MAKNTALFALLGLGLLAASPVAAQTQPLTDDGLAAAVKKKFINERGVPATVKISVDGDVVKLSGKVYSPFAQKRAEEVARSVDGVRVVVNYTMLDLYERPDEDLRLDVERGLLVNDTIESYEVAASVTKGHVRLTGEVDSDIERQTAERVAWDVPGVIAVENAITISATPDRSDAEIREDIAEQLSWDPTIEEELVFVSVKDGEVTIIGNVGTEAERDMLEKAVMIDGVRSVDASGIAVVYFAQNGESFSKVVPVGAGYASSGPGGKVATTTKTPRPETAALLPVKYDDN